MGNHTFTVIIVPERSSKVRRLQIPRKRLVQLAVAGLTTIGLALFLLVHYAFVVDEARNNRALKEENITLKSRLRIFKEEIVRIDGTLQRIDQLSTKVRAITELNDPERNLAIGPLDAANNGAPPQIMYAQDERIDDEDEVLDSKLAMRLVDSKIETLESEALRQENSLRDLHELFAENEALLTAIPSIRPVKSKMLTSAFGVRVDPYTNHQVMHKGCDFAAEHGAEVVAPADGLVIFAGFRGEYGKSVVIDHGFGWQTHYAHLSNNSVDVGQSIKRGQTLGTVGKTGRTTGVHLHYEVRLNGLPQDPEKYILD